MTINKLPTLRRVLVKKLTVPELVKKFPTLVEPKGWSLHLQDPATCPCPDQFSPHTPQPPTKTISWKSIHLAELRWYTKRLTLRINAYTNCAEWICLFIYLSDDAFLQVLGLHSIGYQWNGLERGVRKSCLPNFQNHRGICPTKPQARRSLNDIPLF